MSPNKEYSLRLSDKLGPDKDYVLTLSFRNREKAHYTFKGELINACWDPLGQYVAINNHWGHAGFWLWIISLYDGSVVTTRGLVRGDNYDKYIDDQTNSPDVLEAAIPKIQEIYPRVRKDTSQEGCYGPIAYDWQDREHLKTYSRVIFNNLYDEEGNIVQIYATFNVSRSGLNIGTIFVKKVKDYPEPVPSEIERTLDFVK